MQGSEDQNNSNRRLGAFVTNKWLVGVLITLLMAMGSYIFTMKDHSSEAQASQIQELRMKTTELAIQASADRAEARAQNTEIIRRLDRIERNQDIIRRRNEAP